MAKVAITGKQRRDMLDAAQSGKAKWSMLTHKEKKEAREYEEHKMRLAKAKKEVEHEKKEVLEEQKIPMTKRIKIKIIKFIIVLIVLGGIYAYLRYARSIDLLMVLKGLLTR